MDTTNPLHGSEQNDPSRELAQAAERLAALLVEAEPLVHRLDVPDTAKYRARVRELVGGMRYFELATSLDSFCSERAWHLTHARTDAERRGLTGQPMSSIAFDGTRIYRRK